jgi:hypothetical protein
MQHADMCILHYMYRRAEGNRNLKASEYHSTDGPYSVEYVRYKNPLSTMFVDACKQVCLTCSIVTYNYCRHNCVDDTTLNTYMQC